MNLILKTLYICRLIERGPKVELPRGVLQHWGQICRHMAQSTGLAFRGVPIHCWCRGTHRAAHVPNGCPPYPEKHLKPKELVPSALPTRLEERQDKPLGWGLGVPDHLSPWTKFAHPGQPGAGSANKTDPDLTLDPRFPGGQRRSTCGLQSRGPARQAAAQAATLATLSCESLSAKTLPAQRPWTSIPHQQGRFTLPSPVDMTV